MSKVATYVRPLYDGPPLEQGKDVTAVQRALRAEGSLRKPVTAAAYGANTWDAVKRFQKTHGIQATGDYGKATHAKLAPWFDAYGRWLLTQAKEDLKPDPRRNVADAAFWYYGERATIKYSQARPIPTVYHGIRPPETPGYLDCSGLAITTYWAVGLAGRLGDENAHGFGNTWSLARHGKRVDRDDLRPADLVFYGDCSHVAVYVGNGRVVSHGHYPMGLYPVNYRGDYWGSRSYLP